MVKEASPGAHLRPPGHRTVNLVLNGKAVFRKSNRKLKRVELIGDRGRKISSRSVTVNEPVGDSVTQDVP